MLLSSQEGRAVSPLVGAPGCHRFGFDLLASPRACSSLRELLLQDEYPVSPVPPTCQAGWTHWLVFTVGSEQTAHLLDVSICG